MVKEFKRVPYTHCNSSRYCVRINITDLACIWPHGLYSGSPTTLCSQEDGCTILACWHCLIVFPVHVPYHSSRGDHTRWHRTQRSIRRPRRIVRRRGTNAPFPSSLWMRAASGRSVSLPCNGEHLFMGVVPAAFLTPREYTCISCAPTDSIYGSPCHLLASLPRR